MYFDLKIWLGLVLFRIDVELLFLGLFCNHFFFLFQNLCYHFFFKDFSSKFVWHKTFESVPDFS